MRREDFSPTFAGVVTENRPAPLLPAAAGLIAGITFDHFAAPATWFYAVGTILPIAWLAARGRLRGHPAVAGAIAAMLLGGVRHALADRYLAPNHIWFHSREEPLLTTVIGSVVTTPEIIEPEPDIPRAYAAGPRTRFILEATELAGAEGPVPVSGKVAMNVRDAVLTLRTGDQVDITGWLYRPPRPQNPGGFDWRLHQRRQGLRVGLSCQHAESVRILRRGSPDSWGGLLTRARTHLRDGLLQDAFDPDDPAAGVVAAMVLAQRSAVSRELNTAFVRTGNAHFLAASGINVAWLALMGWTMARLIGAHYRPTAVFIALLILSYMLLAEPEPSILRASIGGLLWCASIFLRGRAHGLNWLACSCIVVLLINPMELFRAAFQFSFLGVLALLYFCPHVAAGICWLLLKMRLPREAIAFDRTRWAPLLTVQLQSDEPSRITGRLALWLLELIAISISAWLVTMPLSCLLFNLLTPWGWLNTFLVSFVALPLTCLGYAAAVAGLLFPTVNSVLAPLLAGLSGVMIQVVEWLSRLPGTALTCRPSAPLVIVTYIAFGAWLYRREQIRRLLTLAAVQTTLGGADFIDAAGDSPDLATSALGPLGPPPTPRSNVRAFLAGHGFKCLFALFAVAWIIPADAFRFDRGALNVWMLAVGDGTGTVIEMPDGRVWVYDFGTRSDFDVGPLATAFLRHRGIRRIDTVIISHANFDHYSGMETLLREFRVDRVVISEYFEPFAPEGEAARRCLEAIRSSSVPIEMLHGPCVLAASAGIAAEVLWPPSRTEQGIVDVNDTSIVLRLAYQGRTVMLTGDIEEMGQAALIVGGSARADVLALPHHGGVVHNTAALVEAVYPTVAVRSSGQRHALTTSGIETLVGNRRYYNTADDGCVRVTIRDGDIAVRSMREGL